MAVSFEALLAERVVLLDGAMGTRLVARGLPAGSAPERWNLERPEEVLAVHSSYVAAGSDVIQTNTFGANPLALARHGIEGLMVEINRAAVALARQAAGIGCLVAGNIGPSGRLLAPVGDLSIAEATACFRRQAEVLAEAGVDYISVETMIDLAEARCALCAVREATDLAVSVCLSFERRKRGHFTLMGDRPQEAMRILAGEGAVAVGVNCSLGSADVLQLVPELLAGSGSAPVIVKPNAGLPELVEGRTVYREEPLEFARNLLAAVERGARAVGGCCGTDERHIAALRDRLGTQ